MRRLLRDFTHFRQGINAPANSTCKQVGLGRPLIPLALRERRDKLGALCFREAVRIAGHEVHGIVQLLIAGGSDDVRRFDSEGARHRGNRGWPGLPLAVDIPAHRGRGKTAASASSFWLMPRFLSRAARLTPISSVNQYPFLVDDASCVLIISMEWFPKK